MTHASSIDAGTSGVSPFHAGEIAIQERLGARGIEQWARKVVRDHMPDQHRDFFSDQPFLVLSARDEQGRPWATIVEGKPGFVSSPDPTHLRIDARPPEGDALEQAFTDDVDVGILGIELATRRRNRVNGRVLRRDEDRTLLFEVGQSFGNCPQYIREREYRWSEIQARPRASRTGRLTPSQANWIRSADTFFIASGHRGEGESAAFGMDVSHRGGERGFVEVTGDSVLRFPDYAGNNHYNTLGNLELDRRAGLLFLDFSTGSLLQLTGAAQIEWDADDLDRFPGARRIVRIDVEAVVELTAALHLRWTEDAEAVRSLRLVEKTRESADVTSFLFEARDGGRLAPFESGQHLPLELAVSGGGAPARRTYSLSGASSGSRYRISVKREPKGLVSRFLHDEFEPGAIVSARRPAGDFVLSDGQEPVVLVSAGVGITPMMSFLHDLVAEGKRSVWFIHGARNGDHHAFRNEVRQLASGRDNINVSISYSQPGVNDVTGKDFDREGRVDAALVLGLVPTANAQFYLCGPTRFMGELRDGLERAGVDVERIRFETFGAVSG